MTAEITPEPGRHVSESGQIIYVWPPEGRYADLWQRFDAALTDSDKHELAPLLRRWTDANSTLVAYTDDTGEWVDVEPDWTEPQRWLGDPDV